MRIKGYMLLLWAVGMCSVANAQRSYSIIQAGANLGFANEGYKGAFSGFAAHFIFGKNFNDRAYLGFGLGNEMFKGDYRTNDPHEPEQQTWKYDYNLFPLFVDGRLPFGLVGENGKIGALVNGGYAPAISQQYDRGFLFKGGFFYLIESPKFTNFTVSLAYGYQQLTKNYFRKDFQHQHFALSVGLMFK